jgi:hypothetical protein
MEAVRKRYSHPLTGSRVLPAVRGLYSFVANMLASRLFGASQTFRLYTVLYSKKIRFARNLGPRNAFLTLSPDSQGQSTLAWYTVYW